MGQVGCHFGVSGLVGTKELVDYQLGLGSYVQLLDAHIFCELESGDECFILRFIVGGSEATVDELLDKATFQLSEDQTDAMPIYVAQSVH